jgi:hypothetical protein
MLADRPPSISFEPSREEDLDEEYRVRFTEAAEKWESSIRFPGGDCDEQVRSGEEQDSGSEASAHAGAQALSSAAPPDGGA